MYSYASETVDMVKWQCTTQCDSYIFGNSKRCLKARGIFMPLNHTFDKVIDMGDGQYGKSPLRLIMVGH